MCVPMAIKVSPPSISVLPHQTDLGLSRPYYSGQNIGELLYMTSILLVRHLQIFC
ncbi:hypothetical protein M404DRAFT_997030 [Pisolithus tinctorius Marx 270]|uniref:Uncharacterized protein n=1 Tax=Pisolithus tinctorius Marx 270 TaxID=870435 RepID=A0A0C3KGW8_PISTI|nr:hypothetical protein M404DRAFT_997030 [Pisolithus tinctorius Marx 270]